MVSTSKTRLILGLVISSLFIFVPSAWSQNDSSKTSDTAKKQVLSSDKNQEKEIDVSDLADKYWRPQKDELEVVQNRRFPKRKRFELGVQYGFYLTHEFTDSSSFGFSLTYNISERWALEAMYQNISNVESDFLKSTQQQFNFTPDFNNEESAGTFAVTWTPVYAKFALLGSKISHFETYFSAGGGYTQTVTKHFTAMLAVGERFYITKGLVLRFEWRKTWYTDEIAITQGANSVANGGTGVLQDDISRTNLLVGLGWLF